MQKSHKLFIYVLSEHRGGKLKKNFSVVFKVSSLGIRAHWVRAVLINFPVWTGSAKNTYILFAHSKDFAACGARSAARHTAVASARAAAAAGCAARAAARAAATAAREMGPAEGVRAGEGGRRRADAKVAVDKCIEGSLNP